MGHLLPWGRMCLWGRVGASQLLPEKPTCASDPPPSLQRCSLQDSEDSDTKSPTPRAPSSRRSQAPAWEAAGSWNSPPPGSRPKRVPPGLAVGTGSWQGQPSLPATRFVPSIQHLSPVLGREGARRGLGRVVMVRACAGYALCGRVHVCTQLVVFSHL